LPVKTIRQAHQVIQYYKHRWIIERFHFLLKSGGAKVEELNFKEVKQLKNALVSYSLATMNVLNIKYLSEKQPDLPINQAGISPIQHQAVHKHIDKRIIYDAKSMPTIKEFCILLGRIAGFIPSKARPLPGLKILSRAWFKLSIIVNKYLDKNKLTL